MAYLFTIGPKKGIQAFLIKNDDGDDDLKSQKN